MFEALISRASCTPHTRPKQFQPPPHLCPSSRIHEMASLNRILPALSLRRALAPLPRGGSVLPTTASLSRRYTTPNNSNNPPELAKPLKFNPPSHGSRLPRSSASPGYNGARSYNFPKDAPQPRHIGEYPHTLPPPDTWRYFFLTNRSLHFYFSLTILFVLAGIVSVTNFMKTSPFAHLVEWDWSAPGRGVASFWDAWRLNMEYQTRLAKEKRERMLEEVEKRGQYRLAHGLEKEGDEGGFGGWALKREKTDEEKEAEGVEEKKDF
ncbi:hypothetical protein DFH27DRAFT_557033 [Peziza echinospora]|nr:hypothetical protein DFH27DRAFT_557033 [Peziza echinospora]